MDTKSAEPTDSTRGWGVHDIVELIPERRSDTKVRSGEVVPARSMGGRIRSIDGGGIVVEAAAGNVEVIDTPDCRYYCLVAPGVPEVPQPAAFCSAAHADDALMDLRCRLTRGHQGDHRQGVYSWAASPRPAPPAEVPQPAAAWEQINERLHALVVPDADVCRSACTHGFDGEWSLLGVANVAARALGQPRPPAPPAEVPAQSALVVGDWFTLVDVDPEVFGDLPTRPWQVWFAEETARRQGIDIAPATPPDEAAHEEAPQSMSHVEFKGAEITDTSGQRWNVRRFNTYAPINTPEDERHIEPMIWLVADRATPPDVGAPEAEPFDFDTAFAADPETKCPECGYRRFAYANGTRDICAGAVTDACSLCAAWLAGAGPEMVAVMLPRWYVEHSAKRGWSMPTLGVGRASEGVYDAGAACAAALRGQPEQEDGR